MAKKTKHLRIRITEAQFKEITNALISQERSKSRLVRNALNQYLCETHGDIPKKE